MNNDTVGSKIRAIRLKKRLSRADVASHVGISEETLARYERAERPITITTVSKIADALECSVLELLGVEVTHDLCNGPAETTARFAETVDRMLDLCETIDEPKGITETVEDLIHNGEENDDASRQFIKQLGEAITKSILLLRLLSLNTPEAAEALEAIASIPRAA